MEITPVRDRVVELAMARRRDWFIAVLALSALAAVTLRDYYHAGHTQYVSWYVPVTADGAQFAPRAIPSEYASPNPPAASVLDEIQWWLHDARAWSSDEAAEQGRLNRIAARATGDAAIMIRRQFVERQRAIEAHTLTPPIDFHLRWLRQESNHHYIAGWVESMTGTAGKVETSYTGELDIQVEPPQDERKMLENPMGFYVTRFSFGEEK